MPESVAIPDNDEETPLSEQSKTDTEVQTQDKCLEFSNKTDSEKQYEDIYFELSIDDNSVTPYSPEDIFIPNIADLGPDKAKDPVISVDTEQEVIAETGPQPLACDSIKLVSSERPEKIKSPEQKDISCPVSQSNDENSLEPERDRLPVKPVEKILVEGLGKERTLTEPVEKRLQLEPVFGRLWTEKGEVTNLTEAAVAKKRFSEEEADTNSLVKQIEESNLLEQVAESEVDIILVGDDEELEDETLSGDQIGGRHSVEQKKGRFFEVQAEKRPLAELIGITLTADSPKEFLSEKQEEGGLSLKPFNHIITSLEPQGEENLGKIVEEENLFIDPIKETPSAEPIEVDIVLVDGEEEPENETLSVGEIANIHPIEESLVAVQVEKNPLEEQAEDKLTIHPTEEVLSPKPEKEKLPLKPFDRILSPEPEIVNNSGDSEDVSFSLKIVEGEISEDSTPLVLKEVLEEKPAEKRLSVEEISLVESEERSHSPRLFAEEQSEEPTRERIEVRPSSIEHSGEPGNETISLKPEGKLCVQPTLVGLKVEEEGRLSAKQIEAIVSAELYRGKSQEKINSFKPIEEMPSEKLYPKEQSEYTVPAKQIEDEISDKPEKEKWFKKSVKQSLFLDEIRTKPSMDLTEEELLDVQAKEQPPEKPIDKMETAEPGREKLSAKSEERQPIDESLVEPPEERLNVKSVDVMLSVEGEIEKNSDRTEGEKLVLEPTAKEPSGESSEEILSIEVMPSAEPEKDSGKLIEERSSLERFGERSPMKGPNKEDLSMKQCSKSPTIKPSYKLCSVEQDKENQLGKEVQETVLLEPLEDSNSGKPTEKTITAEQREVQENSKQLEHAVPSESVDLTEDCDLEKCHASEESSSETISTDGAELIGQTNVIPDMYKIQEKITYECDGCQKMFSTKRFYLHHLHRVTSQVKYECEKCQGDVKFSNICLLKDHLKAHGVSLSIQRLKLSLPNIKEFATSFMADFDFFADTAKTTETDETKLVECPECFGMVTTLRDHLTEPAVKFANPNEPWCDLCELFFPTYCSLKMHKRMHAKSKPYVCPECGKQFITWNYFDNHLLKECFHYYRSVRLRCLFCGEMIECGGSSANAYLPLHSHIQNSHGANFFKCYICNALFKLYTDVYPHILSAHKEESEKINKRDLLKTCKYSQCLLCPGTTLVPTLRLYGHAQKHFVDSIHRIHGYFCETCKTFTREKDRFKKHLKVRHGLQLSPNAKLKRVSTNHEANTSTSDETLKSSHTTLVNMLKSNTKKLKLAISEPTKATVNSESPKEKAATRLKPLASIANTIIHSVPSKDFITKCQLCSNFLLEDQIKLHFESYHKINCSNKAFYSYYIKKVPKPDSLRVWSIEDTPELEASRAPKDKKDCSSSSEPPTKKKKMNDGSLDCSLCDFTANSTEELKNHFPSHRSSVSWQCMECGKCFVTSASLEIHLVLSHQISDPKKYVDTNSVHNANEVRPEHLKDHQCSVCLLELPDSAALQSHFRKHGLAFLKKINQSTKK